jgi:hypothetical protein
MHRLAALKNPCARAPVTSFVVPCRQAAPGPRADLAEDSQLDARVAQLYGALLRGPVAGHISQHRGQLEGANLGVGSPEGTQALSEAIHALLERHVEYIHQAHHHLMPVGCLRAKRMF